MFIAKSFVAAMPKLGAQTALPTRFSTLPCRLRRWTPEPAWSVVARFYPKQRYIAETWASPDNSTRRALGRWTRSHKESERGDKGDVGSYGPLPAPIGDMVATKCEFYCRWTSRKQKAFWKPRKWILLPVASFYSTGVAPLALKPAIEKLLNKSLLIKCGERLLLHYVVAAMLKERIAETTRLNRLNPAE